MASKDKPDWPATSVKMISVAELVPYAKNARTHNDEQVNQIAAAISEWGWTNPILVDDAGMIIAGHGRVLAAKKLGIDQVPVMIAQGWTDEQKRAYVLADNQIAANSDWDMQQLAAELGTLQASDFNIDLTGFSVEAVTKLKEATESSGVEEIPTTEVSDKFWISIRGPMSIQADVLKGVKDVVNAVPGAELDLGVISLEQ